MSPNTSNNKKNKKKDQIFQRIYKTLISYHKMINKEKQLRRLKQERFVNTSKTSHKCKLEYQTANFLYKVSMNKKQIMINTQSISNLQYYLILIQRGI